MARSVLQPDQIGLREAADSFGVSVDTLRRRIKDDLLPEAELVPGQFGNTWVVPTGEMETIAIREGWTLQTSPHQDEAAQENVAHTAGGMGTNRDSDQTGRAQAVHTDQPMGTVQTLPPAPPAPPASWSPNRDRGNPPAGGGEPPSPPDATVVDLRTGAVRVPGGAGGESLTAEVLAELVSVREAITEAEVRAATAEARTGHLDTELERQAASLRRAEADLEYWKTQHDRLKEDVESERGRRVKSEQAASVAEALVEELRGQQSHLLEEQARVVAERNAHAQALREAEGAMGWWSRRRHAKNTSNANTNNPGEDA